MLYLFLDESGDLGFDFVQKKPSKYFVVTILYVKGEQNRRKIKLAVKRTLKKLNSRKGKQRIVQELKGVDTTFNVKKYFYERVKNVEFGIYTIILNKRRVFQNLTFDKERLYNFISRLLFENVPVENSQTGLELILDKCKAKPEIKEFNDYVLSNLQARIDPKIPVYFNHLDSKVVPELQATDLFSWGMFRKYEKQDLQWYKIFFDDGKVQFEDIYLK